MSSLWTPDGERPVGREPTQPSSPADPGPFAGAEPYEDELDAEAMEAQMAELQQRLSETPAEIVIANHAFGLFELAALHLSTAPPRLDQAQLAIDAMGALVEGLAGRLGEGEQQLLDGLSQLRLAFVQVKAANP
jgi:hypothetical protein